MQSIYETHKVRLRYKKDGSWNNSQQHVIEIDRVSERGGKVAQDLQAQLAKAHEESKKEYKGVSLFYKFVISSYKDVLTKKQAQYIEDVLNDTDDNYSKYSRHRYRRTISQRLAIAFLGEGAIGMRPSLMEEYRRNIDIITELLESADDNKAFTGLLMSYSEHPIISRIIWQDVSKEAVKWFNHREKYGKLCEVPVQYLNEVYERLNIALKGYHDRGLR